MSRAAEITLLLILAQASLGFVDSIGMFSAHYVTGVSNNASYTISDLNQYQTSGSVTDELLLAAHWIWEGFFIGINIILTVIFVFPMLIGKFNIPIELSIFIQAGIYFVYASFYAQYKSGKGWFQIKEV